VASLGVVDLQPEAGGDGVLKQFLARQPANGYTSGDDDVQTPPCELACRFQANATVGPGDEYDSLSQVVARSENSIR
jgi:hypothetical protein